MYQQLTLEQKREEDRKLNEIAKNYCDKHPRDNWADGKILTVLEKIRNNDKFVKYCLGV